MSQVCFIQETQPVSMLREKIRLLGTDAMILYRVGKGQKAVNATRKMERVKKELHYRAKEDPMLQYLAKVSEWPDNIKESNISDIWIEVMRLNKVSGWNLVFAPSVNRELKKLRQEQDKLSKLCTSNNLTNGDEPINMKEFERLSRAVLTRQNLLTAMLFVPEIQQLLDEYWC